MPGCEECLRSGAHWVHLRMCATCGHIGCCDSSPNTAGNPFVGGSTVEAPILQVMIFIGFLFVIVNFALSRLSRRLELREGRRTAGAKRVTVTGVEDHAVAPT